MAGDDGRMPLPKDDKIPVSKKKEFLGKVLFFGVLVVLLLGIVTVDHCFNDAEKTAEIAQQKKDDGLMVEIDGLEWKRTTFFDEYDRCWKIYVSTDMHAGDIHGQKAFSTPCPGVKP